MRRDPPRRVLDRSPPRGSRNGDRSYNGSSSRGSNYRGSNYRGSNYKSSYERRRDSYGNSRPNNRSYRRSFEEEPRDRDDPGKISVPFKVTISNSQVNWIMNVDHTGIKQKIRNRGGEVLTSPHRW